MVKTQESTQKQTKGQAVFRWLMRAAGVIVSVFSLIMLVQVLPLVFIFIGGLIGIPGTVDYTSMDTLIWVMTSLTAGAIIVALTMKWFNFIWSKLVVNPPMPGFMKK